MFLSFTRDLKFILNCLFKKYNTEGTAMNYYYQLDVSGIGSMSFIKFKMKKT